MAVEGGPGTVPVQAPVEAVAQPTQEQIAGNGGAPGAEARMKWDARNLDAYTAAVEGSKERSAEIDEIAARNQAWLDQQPPLTAEQRARNDAYNQAINENREHFPGDAEAYLEHIAEQKGERAVAEHRAEVDREIEQMRRERFAQSIDSEHMSDEEFRAAMDRAVQEGQHIADYTSVTTGETMPAKELNTELSYEQSDRLDEVFGRAQAAEAAGDANAWREFDGMFEDLSSAQKAQYTQHRDRTDANLARINALGTEDRSAAGAGGAQVDADADRPVWAGDTPILGLPAQDAVSHDADGTPRRRIRTGDPRRYGDDLRTITEDDDRGEPRTRFPGDQRGGPAADEDVDDLPADADVVEEDADEADPVATQPVPPAEQRRRRIPQWPGWRKAVRNLMGLGPFTPEEEAHYAQYGRYSDDFGGAYAAQEVAAERQIRDRLTQSMSEDDPNFALSYYATAYAEGRERDRGHVPGEDAASTERVAQDIATFIAKNPDLRGRRIPGPVEAPTINEPPQGRGLSTGLRGLVSRARAAATRRGGDQAVTMQDLEQAMRDFERSQRLPRGSGLVRGRSFGRRSFAPEPGYTGLEGLFTGRSSFPA